MDLVTLCLIGAIALALMLLVAGAFFSGERISEERFERKLSDEESEKNRKILEANVHAMSLSDDAIAQRLSKHNKGVKLTVYPGGRKDEP